MLNAQDYFDKHLLHLDREWRELWRHLYTRVALDQPMQRGWRRFHALTADAKRRADQDVLLTLLEIIGTTQFRRSPDFRKRRGRGRNRRSIEIEQPLRELTVGEWTWRCLPEEWKPYFRRENRRDACAWRQVLAFASPHLFELKIEPNWITEIDVINPAVEERIVEIDGWLSHRHALPRLDWLYGRSNYWSQETRNKLLEKIARREIREAVLDLSEAEPAASKWRSLLSFRRIVLIFPGVAQCRGNELRPRPVRVRVLPPGPLCGFPPLIQLTLP